jgi:hypothetical protein
LGADNDPSNVIDISSSLGRYQDEAGGADNDPSNVIDISPPSPLKELAHKESDENPAIQSRQRGDAQFYAAPLDVSAQGPDTSRT